MDDWIVVSEKRPPIGEWILTACAKKDWPCMKTNALREGDGKLGREIGLYYWDSGDDFDDVTHWQPLPPMPPMPPTPV